MAIEALCTMGREDAVGRWLDRYRPLLAPRPPRARTMAAGEWRAALGDRTRMTDWFALFEDELATRPWRDVVDTWVARLAPAFCASAMHGVIRTGHAVRALGLAETPERRRELADGLASWAAEYQTLPTAVAPPRPQGRPHDAIRRVPIVPEAERRFTGTIVASLERLAEFPPFADAIGMADLSGDPAATVSELTETFARVYLGSARDPLGTVVFVHGVTSAAALRSLLPALSETTARAALAYAWQAGCALYAAFGHAPAPAGEIAPPPESRATLVDLAIANGDEHAIKLTEACLREDAIRPSAAYRAAARHASRVLGG
jgi:hypothetical protein